MSQTTSEHGATETEEVRQGRCLVVVPCGARKIWAVHPRSGSALARDAYVGSPFKVNRAYAERFGDRWVILSAKYGFIDPDFTIPGDYNVTFKRASTHPVTVETLRQQVLEQDLDRFPLVIGLGGKEYRERVQAAFAGTDVQLSFPFAGLSLGKSMQAAKWAIACGDPSA